MKTTFGTFHTAKQSQKMQATNVPTVSDSQYTATKTKASKNLCSYLKLTSSQSNECYDTLCSIEEAIYGTVQYCFFFHNKSRIVEKRNFEDFESSTVLLQHFETGPDLHVQTYIGAHNFISENGLTVLKAVTTYVNWSPNVFLQLPFSSGLRIHIFRIDQVSV